MMTLDERKNEIKNIALNNYSNGAAIYILVNKNYLDHIINKINDDKTYTNTTSIVKKGYLTGNEQFVDILNETLLYFDSHFLPLEDKELHFANILEKSIPKFLLCKKYWGNNSYIPYYTNNIQKLLVKNFYNNIKYIYNNFEDFFKTINITPKMSLNNSDDLGKLFEFLEELVWCNCKYQQFSLYYIFSNHKFHLEDVKNNYEIKNVDIKNIIFKDYVLHWEILIKQYKKNISYVKNFISLS